MITQKRTSLLTKFYLKLLVIYLMSVVLFITPVFYFTYQQVKVDTEKELFLLSDVINAFRRFIGKDLRPELLAKKIYFPPAISSTVATKHFSAIFGEAQPQYSIRIASDNPLNNDNLPMPLEADLLARFRADRTLKGLIEVGEINGRLYLASSKPEKVKGKNCLICHGDPTKAPLEITKRYGTTHGYGWNLGAVIGVSVVGVPLADVISIAIHRSIIVMLMLTAVFALLFIIITIHVKRHFLIPLMQIAASAKEVSKGALDKSLKVERNDEVGDLSNSFELLRRSLVVVTRRLRSKRE